MFFVFKDFYKFLKASTTTDLELFTTTTQTFFIWFLFLDFRRGSWIIDKSRV
jgi:hypothetical protein